MNGDSEYVKALRYIGKFEFEKYSIEWNVVSLDQIILMYIYLPDFHHQEELSIRILLYQRLMNPEFPEHLVLCYSRERERSLFAEQKSLNIVNFKISYLIRK